MENHADCASTVTSLFVEPTFKKSARENWIKSPVKKPVGTFDETPYYSSSKMLRKYIEHYEKEETLDLARSLTVNHRNHIAIPERLKSEDQVFIDREISLAKSLLPRKSEETNFLGSMTTDELLASTPYVEGLESDNLDGVPHNKSKDILECPSRVQGSVQFYKRPFSVDNKENTRSMHFSDFSRTNLNSMQRNSKSSSEYCLNGISYTPHRVKYRNILTETDSVNHESTVGTSCNDSGDCVSETRKTTADQRFKCFNNYSRLMLTDKTGYFSPPESAKLSENAGRTPFHPRFTDRTSVSPSSVSTEAILQGERPWECRKSLFKNSKKSLDSPSHYSVPFCFDDRDSKIRGFMEDCIAAGDSAKLGHLETNDKETSSDGQIGPVETLKNMLFTLQSMSEHADTDRGSLEEDSAENDILKQDVNGGQMSFKKAMSHLANLKEILGSTATSE